MKSIVCGDPDTYEDFTFVVDTLRSTDKTDPENVENSWDFADAWYHYILQLRLLASSDQMVGNVYYTRLPEEVTIFHIEEFLDRLDSRITDKQHQELQENSYLNMKEIQEVEQCGRAAFGDLWDDVWDSLVLSEHNLGAHPFLVAVDVEEEYEPNRNLPPRKRETTKVVYPRFFAQTLKFQLFPLLKNGDEPRSHTILSQLTAERGESYERNMYEYLDKSGLECYQGAEVTKSNPNEIDLIVELPEKILFIEMKYLMPPAKINEREGIMELNEKFDRTIFNEVSEDSDREPEGKPFPEKVGTWMDLAPGDRFVSRDGSENNNRNKHKISEDWNNLESEMIVLSNVVPSYPVKEGVRFLTDLEFYQWMEHGDKSAFY
ncbi:hypothetical protein [Halobellus limi]|nr:hypothetical protein [Halobellus limi]